MHLQTALSETQGQPSGLTTGSVGRRHTDDAYTRLQHFTCGLAAGLLAKLASHPLDVAKKRFQVAGLPRSLRYGARVSEQVRGVCCSVGGCCVCGRGGGGLK